MLNNNGYWYSFFYLFKQDEEKDPLHTFGIRCCYFRAKISIICLKLKNNLRMYTKINPLVDTIEGHRLVSDSKDENRTVVQSSVNIAQ